MNYFLCLWMRFMKDFFLKKKRKKEKVSNYTFKLCTKIQLGHPNNKTSNWVSQQDKFNQLDSK